jgi:WD40 repeat protein
VWSVAFSPDGGRILGGDDGGARVWDAATGAVLRRLGGDPGRVRSVAFSPDGGRILTGDDGGRVRVWDAATGQPTGFTMATLPGGELAVFDAVSHTLVGASEGAWRWLGWNVIQDGRLTRLPAETFGALPPLRQPTG